MKSDPRVAEVSVVLPCYRCASTIERAIRSVAQQSLLPAEIVIVDDGSGEGTLNLIRKLATEFADGWIRIITLDKNQGAATARNVGWDEARYPFVAFLDSDDAWHRRKIEIQYTFLSTHTDVTVCGHRHSMIETGAAEPVEVQNGSGAVTVVGKVALLLSNRFITPSVMLRRDLQLRFETGRRHMEDHLLWMRAACAGYRVVRLETPLAWIFKAPYGSGGLSSELWPMERGSLGNYLSLRREGCIGWIEMALFVGYSLLKYCRRLAIVGMRRWLAVDRRRKGDAD